MKLSFLPNIILSLRLALIYCPVYQLIFKKGDDITSSTDKDLAPSRQVFFLKGSVGSYQAFSGLSVGISDLSLFCMLLVQLIEVSKQWAKILPGHFILHYGNKFYIILTSGFRLASFGLHRC